MEERPRPAGRLNALGEALAAGQSPAPGVPSYQEVMRWYDGHTRAARTIVSEMPWKSMLGDRGYQVSSRTKTVDTLVQKLQRHGNMRMARVGDISGVRFEADMTLDEQEAAAQAIAAAFEEACGRESKIKDLREVPHQGYRAVHVMAHLSAPVEVQVRTSLQGDWANLYETFGDLHGREIRYEDGSRPQGVEIMASFFRDISTGRIAQLERSQNDLTRHTVLVQMLRSSMPALPRKVKKRSKTKLQQLHDALDRTNRIVSASRDEVRESMSKMHEQVQSEEFTRLMSSKEGTWLVS